MVQLKVGGKHMNINVINNIINSIRKGTFFRIVYKTEVPVKATYKQMGLKFVKLPLLSPEAEN